MCLLEVVWIVNKVVGENWSDAPECKVAPVFIVGVTCLSMYTEILCLTS